MGRTKMDKMDYPIPEGGLTGWPADWDKSKHKPLTPDNFAGTAEHHYWDHKAAEFYAKGTHASQQSELCRKFGDREERKAAASALRKMKQAQEMLAQLEAAGVSAEDLEALKNLG
jgi:hypothetical protein